MVSDTTGSTVLDWLIRDRELSQIVINHFRLDLNPIESLAVIYSNNTFDHIILRRWVLTSSGFSPAGASRFALQNFLIKVRETEINCKNPKRRGGRRRETEREREIENIL